MRNLTESEMKLVLKILEDKRDETETNAYYEYEKGNEENSDWLDEFARRINEIVEKILEKE